MTLSTTTNRASYSGDGSTTVFSAPFLFLANSHIQAVLRDAAGVETTWVENTQYTLTGAGNSAGGALTVKISPTDFTPASGETLVIRRVVPETQETDYPEGGAFPASAHEDALDKLTMLVQQLSEQLARALLSPVSDNSPGALPLKSALASKFLAFDASGDPIASSGLAGDSSVPVSVYMETLLDDVSAAAARTTLGLGDAATATIGAGVQAFNAANAVINAAQTFTKAQRGSITTLADGATITLDMAANNHFTVTLGGNRTLANPTNLVAGQSGSIFVVQDATGSRTLSYGTSWDFKGGAAPTLTTTANAVDRIDYLVRSTGSIHAVWTGDLK